MKKLILGAALAGLLAAPALAQSYDPDYGTGNTMAMPQAWQGQTTGSAFAPATMDRLRGIRAQALPSASADPVYAYGHYVGTDPDANIRLQLRRDPPGLD
jgi:hypothetical protein